MNQQERQIISDIFRRLEEAANQPRDPEAERLIAEKLRAQPYAPYAMAQAIYVQEQALASLNQQIQELQGEVEELRSRPQGGGGGLLSSIFGGGSRPEPRRGASFSDSRTGMGAPQSGPWGQAPSPNYGGPQGGYGQPGPGYGQPGYGQPGMMGGQQPGMMGGFGQQRQGSGFLGSALTTAAGVAGGMVVGNALMNAFKGGHETLGGGASALAGGSDAASLSPFGDTGNAGGFGGGGENAFGAQDASFGGGSDDSGGDFSEDDDGGGGGDEWV